MNVDAPAAPDAALVDRYMRAFQRTREEAAEMVLCPLHRALLSLAEEDAAADAMAAAALAAAP